MKTKQKPKQKPNRTYRISKWLKKAKRNPNSKHQLENFI